MPLYGHVKTGELVRTPPGRSEAARLTASPDWHQLTAEQLAEIRATDDHAARLKIIAAAGKVK